MVSQMLENSTTCTFKFKKLYLCSAKYIYIQQYAFSFNFNPNYFHSTKIFVQLQPKIISFNENNYLTSTTKKNNNNNLTAIFVQLQPKLFSFNKNNYSTLTKNNFTQQQGSRTFKILSFNSIPCPSPVNNIESLKQLIKNLSNTLLRDAQNQQIPLFLLP